jgi:hypothetical protein
MSWLVRAATEEDHFCSKEVSRRKEGSFFTPRKFSLVGWIVGLFLEKKQESSFFTSF